MDHPLAAVQAATAVATGHLACDPAAGLRPAESRLLVAIAQNPGTAGSGRPPVVPPGAPL